MRRLIVIVLGALLGTVLSLPVAAPASAIGKAPLQQTCERRGFEVGPYKRFVTITVCRVVVRRPR